MASNTGVMTITKVPSLNQLGGAARMPPAEAEPFHHSKQFYKKQAMEKHGKQLKQQHILQERRIKARPNLSNEVLRAEQELNNAITHHAPYHSTKPTTKFSRFAQISEEQVKNEHVNTRVEARAKRKMRSEMPMKLKQNQYARQRFVQTKYRDEARAKYSRVNQMQERKAKYNLQRHEMINRAQAHEPTPVTSHQYDTRQTYSKPTGNTDPRIHQAERLLDSEVYKLKGRLSEAEHLEKRFFGRTP